MAVGKPKASRTLSPPCWRRHQIDPQRQFGLTQALARKAALSLRLREFAWVNESRPLGSIWHRRQHTSGQLAANLRIENAPKMSCDMKCRS